MTETVMFTGDLRRQDVDDEELAELIFRPEHPEGGISTATVLVPRPMPRKPGRSSARASAPPKPAQTGGGGAASVNVSLGW